MHIFANGWRETKIEGGIDVPVTRLSLNIKRRISLYASIVRQVEYDLEDRKVRRWGQHDYSTDRPDADGAFGGLEKQIRESGPVLIPDLDEVTLVDVEIVRFLGTCEARGATLLNCSPYIRDWIGIERDRRNGRKTDVLETGRKGCPRYGRLARYWRCNR